MTAPAWYPDPHNPAAYRYFDGNNWTEHTQGAASAPAVVHAGASFHSTANPAGGQTTSLTVVNVGQRKSVGLALVLSFLFGPFGTFYGSVIGGVVLLATSVLIGWLLIPVPFIWIGSMIWAAVGADSHNKRLGASTMTTTQMAPVARPANANTAPPPPHELAAPSSADQPFGSGSQAAPPRLYEGEVVDAEIVSPQESRRSQPNMDW